MESERKAYGYRTMDARQRYEYKKMMRKERWDKHGLTDGLRVDREGMKEYLEKRRLEDSKNRPSRWLEKREPRTSIRESVFKEVKVK